MTSRATNDPDGDQIQINESKTFRGMSHARDVDGTPWGNEGPDDPHWNRMVEERVKQDRRMTPEANEEVERVIRGNTLSEEETQQLIQDLSLNEQDVEQIIGQRTMSSEEMRQLITNETVGDHILEMIHGELRRWNADNSHGKEQGFMGAP